MRRFDAGDQIVFLKNDSALGVKNGMIGKVVEAAAHRIVAEIGEGDRRCRVDVDQRFYRNLDHGYATTIHKSQGSTVDRVKVLASLSLDRHLTYVAMTRHREDMALYYGRHSFGMNGGLINILSRRNAKETTLGLRARHALPPSAPLRREPGPAHCPCRPHAWSPVPKPYAKESPSGGP